MKYITREEADKVVATVNGYDMTLADYYDNMDIEFTITEVKS